MCHNDCRCNTEYIPGAGGVIPIASSPEVVSIVYAYHLLFKDQYFNFPYHRLHHEGDAGTYPPNPESQGYNPSPPILGDFLVFSSTFFEKKTLACLFAK